MIYAVIVTYNPDLTGVSALLESLRFQVDHVIAIDNGSPSGVVLKMCELTEVFGCTLICNNLNRGIAEALNQGIDFARKADASFVLLLDQDSLPANDMVARLKESFELKKNLGSRVAAVGPSYTDIKGQFISPFVRLKGLRLQRIKCQPHEVVAVDHLITSGSLICLSALTVIGDMESLLFIDYVDTEWCLRARARGYDLYGVVDAKMDHDLGDGIVYFMGRKLPIHSPLRYYYLIRNGIWVLRRPWISLQWCIMDARRLVLIYVIYSLFLGKRLGNWKMMTRGLWHGLAGKMGKLI
jgi:rhamnosyltransferase